MTEIILRNGSDVSLEEFMGGDDRTCMSAWVSFGNDDAHRLGDRARVEGLIRFLYRERHMTPFESSLFTFRIKTPLFVAREYHRHRTQSINEWSGRYSEMVPEFYLPPQHRPLVQAGKPGDYHFVAGTSEQYERVVASQTKSFQQSWDSYEELLAAGVAKEVARNALPLSTYTYFYSTMNARNAMHFLSLRNDSHALFEIREVAAEIEKHFAEAMPLTYKAFKEYDWRDDKAEIERLRDKVDQLTSELAWKTGYHAGGSDY